MTEGKTKIITRIQIAHVKIKEDITAGDGARRDIVEGKARASAETITNVFTLLNECGIRTAFIGRDRDDDTMLFMHLCTMIPLEVVVRFEADGSYLERHPMSTKGDPFPEPLVEFYLKTKDKMYQDQVFPCDDPLLRIEGNDAHLYDPHTTLEWQKAFQVLSLQDIFPRGVNDISNTINLMEETATSVARLLRAAFEILERRLVDIKVEFGMHPTRGLLLADDIDNGSWRIRTHEGAYEDKQGYREGESVDETLRKFQDMATLSKRLPGLVDRIM